MKWKIKGGTGRFGVFCNVDWIFFLFFIFFTLTCLRGNLKLEVCFVHWIFFHRTFVFDGTLMPPCVYYVTLHDSCLHSSTLLLWKATECIYPSTVVEYNIEVLAHYLSNHILCYCMLKLCNMLEANVILFITLYLYVNFLN